MDVLHHSSQVDDHPEPRITADEKLHYTTSGTRRPGVVKPLPRASGIMNVSWDRRILSNMEKSPSSSGTCGPHTCECRGPGLTVRKGRVLRTALRLVWNVRGVDLLSSVELNRQLGAHSKMVMPPRQLPSRLVTKYITQVLDSAGPADEPSAFRILVTRPDFFWKWAPSWRFSSRPLCWITSFNYAAPEA
jgi:hypothetical protein